VDPLTWNRELGPTSRDPLVSTSFEIDKSEKGSTVPPEIQLKSDARLGTSTILTSFRTARELRLILGPDHYQIKYGPCLSDDQITVSPDLYDAFHLFITNMSDSHHAA
jgi:hypothetical protein